MDLARRLGENDELYSCRACAKNPALYAQLGHDGPPQNFWRDNLFNGAPLRRCPVRDILEARERDQQLAEEFDRYTTHYYPAYQDGHLLVAGGIADQPARYLALIGALRDASERVAEKHLELTKDSNGGQS